MGALRTATRGAVALAIGAAGVLATMKVIDDRSVDEIWEELERTPTASDRFSVEMVEGLPDPARRYFLHAIKPETPLANCLHWRWSGAMKPSKDAPWMDLKSHQVSARERGFAWKARAGKGPLVLTAADHYLESQGRMRIALYGFLPFVNAKGPDLSRASLGRLVAEGVFMPSALLPGPHVRIEGLDNSRFTVTMDLFGETSSLNITVDEAGRVTETMVPRWGNLTGDGSYQYIPYGGVVEEEGTFGGYTIPTRTRVGWWWGTDRYLEVIHLEVDTAEFR